MKNEEVLESAPRVFLVRQTPDREESAGEPDPFENKYGTGIVKPSYNPDDLVGFVNISNILPQCLRSMAENCDGFGYHLRCTVPEGEERDKLETEIDVERNRVETFFSYVNYDMPFEELRKEVRWDKEAIGSGWMEIIRNRKGDIDGFNYLNGPSMRLGKLSKLIEVDEKRLEAATWDYEKVKRSKRFRLHVQLVGTAKTWFKELGDPRDIDRRTGFELSEKKRAEYERRGIKILLANEVVHFKYGSRTSPYGVPQWIGVSPEIAGCRAAAELNWYTFDNQGIGQFMILLSGGHWAEKQVERIREYVKEMGKKGLGLNQALVLEAVGQQVSPNQQGTTPCRIEVKELGITKEGVFLEYDKSCRDKVRSTLRIPPLLVGLAEDYSRATARESMAVAEQQVFAPARMGFDFFINRKIFPELKVKYHEFVSNSAPADRQRDAVDIIKDAKEAGLPLRQTYAMLEEALEVAIPTENIEGLWLDLPLVLSVELVKLGLLKPPGGREADGDAPPGAPAEPEPPKEPGPPEEPSGEEPDGEVEDKAVAALVRSLDRINRNLRVA